MIRSMALLAGLTVLAAPGSDDVAPPDHEAPIALVVHGGAGSIRPEGISAEREAAYRAGLEVAITTGYDILRGGGAAVDAVEATIRVLEDSPLFNAGKGAVFTAEGRNELDASLMVGASREAGAVAGVTTIKNPISAARAVMEKTPHVLLVGAGAEAFARRAGLEMVGPEYFFTQRRWDAFERQRDEATPPAAEPDPDRGTVGCVALDASGTLAAGTSTGGTTNKMPGRVGDSPIIGAGTWADASCAVSATGDGEYFIRFSIARDICARVELAGETLEQATQHLIHGVLEAAGGGGGVIALARDPEGGVQIHWTFNTDGMFRGAADPSGEIRVALYSED